MKCAYRKDLIRFKTYSTLVERHLPCCKVCLKYSALISEIHYWRFLLSTWIKYPCSHGHAILVFFFFLKSICCWVRVYFKSRSDFESYKHKRDSFFSPHLPWTRVFLLLGAGLALKHPGRAEWNCVSGFVAVHALTQRGWVLNPCLIAHSQDIPMSQTNKGGAHIHAVNSFRQIPLE